MDILVAIVIIICIISIPLVIVVGIGCLPFIILLALFILGIKMVINPWFANREKSRLDENHILIIPQRQVVRVDVNMNVNGYNPYVIDCYYTDENTGRDFVFTSKPFMTDPTPYLNGVTLGVFVNPVDYSNYYVDVSKLPPNL